MAVELAADDVRAWATLVLAVATFVSSFAWQAALIVFFCLFRQPIGVLISNIVEARGPGGVGFKAERPANQPAKGRVLRKPLQAKAVTQAESRRPPVVGNEE